MLGLKIFLKIAATRHFLFNLYVKLRLKRDHKPVVVDEPHDQRQHRELSRSQPCDPRGKRRIIAIVKTLKQIIKLMKRALKFRLSHVLSWLVGVAMSVASFLLTKGQMTIPPPTPPRDIISDTIVPDNDKSVIFMSPIPQSERGDYLMSETVSLIDATGVKNGDQ